MGAVGAAGAAAGLGTSALFSDAEEFANNQITAGQLDLVMDWEEHYSFPQIYSDFDDPTVENGDDLDVIRSDPADDPSLNEDNYTGLPIPETDADGRDPVVWARNNDDPAGTGESSLELYFANTVIEAFPDDGNTDPEGTFTFLDQTPARRVTCSPMFPNPDYSCTTSQLPMGRLVATTSNPGERSTRTRTTRQTTSTNRCSISWTSSRGTSASSRSARTSVTTLATSGCRCPAGSPRMKTV
jgi:predicted ribosomally synthesized peptide with SipW-like signal peptide